MFIYSENKRRADIELLLKCDKVVIYACVEMLESPTLAPLWHSETYSRISAFYIDEAHSIHESSHHRTGYSRMYKLRNILQRVAREHSETVHIPIVALSATCPPHYQ